MGAVNTKAVSPSKKALREYYKWHQKHNGEDDVKLKILKEIFNFYDEDGKGYLSESQATRYVQDLFEIAQIEVIDSTKTEHKHTTDADKKEFTLDIMAAVVHSMDPGITGKIGFESLEKPHIASLFARYNLILALGAGQRHFNRRLRETKLLEESYESSRKAKGDEFRSKAKMTESTASQEINSGTDAEHAFDAALEADHHEAAMDLQILKGSAKTPLQIGQLRDAQVKRVSELLDIEPSIAQKLLHSIQWNEDQLIHEYFEDKDTLLKRVGVTLLDDDGYSIIFYSKVLVGTLECSVCLEDVGPEDYTRLPKCKHEFCNACWKANLEQHIKDGNALDLKCMHSGCKELVPNDLVPKLVSDEFAKKFSIFLDCENALTEFSIEGFIKVGECQCGYRFCWDCSREAHPSVSCELMKQWEDVCSADADSLGWLQAGGIDVLTMTWMRENTKDCPKCGANVQKNDGCYFMKCLGCQAEWCWLCQEDWATHPDHFRCTKFDKGEEALQDKPEYLDEDGQKRRRRMGPIVGRSEAMKDQTAAITNLLSADEKAKRVEQAQKISELVSSSSQFLDKAVHTIGDLVICRESIKYSHVFAFFLHAVVGESSTPSFLLDSLQDGLQMFVEKINSALAQPVEKLDASLIRRLSTSAMNSRGKMIEAFVDMEESIQLEDKIKRMIKGENLKEMEKKEKEKPKEKEKKKK